MSNREKVAREAAELLYNRKVIEYKDAKDIAASGLGINVLPSNFEVAVELEKIVEERESSERLKMLIEMRNIALEVMRKLAEYDPVLIGSVWRGTPRNGSDIDIVVYNEDPNEIERKLSEFSAIILEKKEYIINGLPRYSTHIEYKIKNYSVEIVVRPIRDKEFFRIEKCETYGDIKKGLKLPELERLIQKDPLRRFIPKRRIK
jgi:predicted nucleotidyltransferase